MRTIDADVLNAVSQIDDALDNLPTIDPIKHGEWVEDICCDGRFICNSCGNEAYFDLDEGTYILKYILFDYCFFAVQRWAVIKND